MQVLVPTDPQLALRAREGDIDTLAELLERYRPSLYASAIGILRDRTEAMDAVQETFLVALGRLHTVRAAESVGGWLHTVLRNACLMRLRRKQHEILSAAVDASAAAPDPEQVLEQHAMRDWIWTAIEPLGPEDRLTVIMRYFTRCCSYRAIADVTAVPVGTVRSRLNRARAQLNDALLQTAEAAQLSRTDLEAARRSEWEGFYRTLHEVPEPRTYRDLYSHELDVTDGFGRWHGLDEWSAEEREAITLGVRATIVGLLACRDLTILEVDFANPPSAAGHCPARSTFVHRVSTGRSRSLNIHYHSGSQP